MVLVSFLNNMAVETQLTRDLDRVGVPESVVSQFKFSQARPDLTKIDAMLGLMSCDTEDFAEEAAMVAGTIREHGIAGWMQNEVGVLAQRAATAKQAKVDALMAQLTALAPPDKLQEMLSQVLGQNQTNEDVWEVLSDVGSLSDWDCNSSDGGI